MDIIDSIILGLVEGLTEFLPVSSTGHLILTNHLLGLDGDLVKTFDVFIQLGAILAVVFLYHHRFRMLFNFKQKTGFAGFKGLLLISVTILPIMLVGYLAGHLIKEYLFNPVTVAWALGLGGMLLILVESRSFNASTDSLDNLTIKQALGIGLFQILALWPGASRAGATIIGGLLSGLHRKIAAEYSFIVAVPIMFIVCIKDLADAWHSLQPNDLFLLGIGFLVSFISAFFAVKLFVNLLEKFTMSPFGVYRIAIALVVLWTLA